MTTNEAIKFFLDALNAIEKADANQILNEMRGAYRKALEALLEKEQAEDK